MGCGSSHTQTALIRDMYREPSEFDTCTSVISGREYRGEPDGKEVSSAVGDPQTKSELLHANRKPASRSPFPQRSEDNVGRNKSPGKPETYKNGKRVNFTALSEHNEHDVGGDRHKTTRTANTADSVRVDLVHEVSAMRGVPDEDRDFLVAT
ncbi:uncharacterized protein LOC763836 [Strongylocentrotus purpuratus]|uniref:Uncharacterized protein n=1 Tax=Strongylocentrotus purpuratus TaxID=7668 RepID=A0A7M7NNC3_STRPU|nr:uncharacterized protein LOC763836 [Strongylocentrotus purpuratus]|eukprot:XP_011664377.1 PREDICTED: uncharacterized protein LOC763836 [Strongylocentrotus purpuratus]